MFLSVWCRDWVWTWKRCVGVRFRWRRHDVRTHTNPASKTVVGWRNAEATAKFRIGRMRSLEPRYIGALGVAKVPWSPAVARGCGAGWRGGHLRSEQSLPPHPV